jgi:hypothetical protein
MLRWVEEDCVFEESEEKEAEAGDEYGGGQRADHVTFFHRCPFVGKRGVEIHRVWGGTVPGCMVFL